ncbi:hypothetical protein [Candidatus Palauibacter sp.]|uniref:hypothetical protein n=1 Tax=Candidatus Palauibacter sp. TaxID=3101350 RepID=UPI003C6F665E
MPTCLRGPMNLVEQPRIVIRNYFATGSYGHARSAPSRGMALTQARRARLGEIDDPGTIGLPSWITRLGSGDFVLATPENGAEMLVYDAEGRYRESFGRSGEGPGEFVAPGMGRLRPSPDGGVLILDPMTRRITSLSATRELLGATQIGDMMGMNFLPATSGSGFIVGGWGGSADGTPGGVTRMIDAEGVTLADVGDLPHERWLQQFFFFPMTTDGEGRVWRARPNEYVVEAWDPEDSAVDIRLEGSPDWFTPGPPQPGYPLEAPGPSVIGSLAYDEGLLWIATWVADSEWAEVAGARWEDGALDGNKLMDTVLEVIDPRTGALVARTVHDEFLWRTGDGAFLYALRQDGLVPRAVLYSPSFEGEECPPQDLSVPPRALSAAVVQARRGPGADEGRRPQSLTTAGEDASHRTIFPTARPVRWTA